MSSGPVPPGGAAGTVCDPAELSKLFLFEKLNQEQLGWLCRQGRVVEFEPGPVYAEGDPATCWYVLLSGTVALYRRVGADDVETVRTSNPGVYGGAFFAFLGDRVPQVYNNSMRVTERSRFFVLDADRFAELMTTWFPMATHLLEGLLFGTKSAQEAVGQRERLLALGSLSAGLAHELNNPAAAAARATGALRDRVAGMRSKLALIASGEHDGPFLAALVGLQDEAVRRAAAAQPLSPLDAADSEDEVADWLDEHGITEGWQLAPAFVQAGLDIGWLDRLAGAVDATGRDGPALDGALRWVGYTVETELLMNEIGDSVARISSLVAAARQYSQLDRAPYQVFNVHELLDSTLAMLAGKIGPGVRVVKDYDRRLPRIAGFPAELNQVWTNLIDNAVSAMGGSGTLTIRTAADQDMLLAEFGDTGPGIPEDVRGRIFEPFFTTKPVGEGTGLGLDISWRIVVTRHHGDLRVESAPGDTRFQVRLPIATENSPAHTSEETP
ncbi:MAG TPA: ATP-binding protein [Streptosporangiaceae bacterium]